MIIEYDIDKLNSGWSHIKNYQKIRNVIVHNFGEIPDDDKKQNILDIIESSPYLELSQGKAEILITHEQYLIDFCGVIEDFLENITKDLR